MKARIIEEQVPVRRVRYITTMNRAAHDEYQKGLKGRRDKGRYWLEEAALAFSDGTGERAETMLEKLMEAVRNGLLPVYEPGRLLRYQPKTVRQYDDEALWQDLNGWLETNVPRISWRFPKPVVPKRSNNTNDDDWKVEARKIADECFDSDTKNKCRDSLAGYSRRVMDEMQNRKIPGPRGQIDNSATIQREALQAAKWWSNKSK